MARIKKVHKFDYRLYWDALETMNRNSSINRWHSVVFILNQNKSLSFLKLCIYLLLLDNAIIFACFFLWTFLPYCLYMAAFASIYIHLSAIFYFTSFLLLYSETNGLCRKCLCTSHFLFHFIWQTHFNCPLRTML